MWPLLYDQPWRLVTSLLLHHDLPHLAGNLIFLLLFGWGLERTRGARRIASVFPGAVVTGHVISVTFAHDWIVGISGGVAGLFGYSLIASRRSPWWTTLTHQPLNAVYFLALTAPLLPALAEIFPYRFAHLKHLGGLLDGLAAGTALLSAPAKPLPRALAPHYRCCCLSASFTAPGWVNGGWFDTAQS